MTDEGNPETEAGKKSEWRLTILERTDMLMDTIRPKPANLGSFDYGRFVEVCFMSFKAGLFAPTHSRERDILANALFQNDSTLLKLGHLALVHAIATTTQTHEFHMTGHSTAKMLRLYTHVVAKDIAAKAHTMKSQTKAIR